MGALALLPPDEEMKRSRLDHSLTHIQEEIINIFSFFSDALTTNRQNVWKR